jgi:hypothetical protein
MLLYGLCEFVMPNELSDQAVYSVASGEAILQMGIKQPLAGEIENVCI